MSFILGSEWACLSDYEHSLTFRKSFDLPDDVFAEGEVKPTRAHKKKSNGGAKKRDATEVCGLLTLQWTKFKPDSSMPA